MHAVHKLATKPPATKVALYHIQHFDIMHGTQQYSATVLISTAVQNC